MKTTVIPVEEIAVVKSFNGEMATISPARPLRRAPGLDGSLGNIGITYPDGTNNVLAAVRLMRQGALVGEGFTQITIGSMYATGDAVLTVNECAKTDVPLAYRACAPPDAGANSATDGRVDAQEESPRDAGQPDLPANDRPRIDRDASAVCSAHDGGRSSAQVQDADAGVDAECDDYCRLMVSTCSSVYSDEATCRIVCRRVSEFPRKSQLIGDTLACRRSWALKAKQTVVAGERASACLNAQIGKTEACGRACDIFCRLGTSFCPTEFSAVTNCAFNCSLFASNVPVAESEAVSCQLERLLAASHDSSYCPEATPTPTCGTCRAIPFEGR